MTLARSLRSALPGVSAREWDQSNNDVLGLGGTPEVLIRPVSTEEVSQILTWAGEEGVGVLPLGSGRHVGPVGGGKFVALETSLLSGVDEYEPADLTITSGTGTTFSTVDATLREHGQWAPFDSPGVNERSMGGFVSEASHGPLWAGYGSLRNHVLGATLVTGDGRVLRLGGKVVKNVAGYDLLRPVVGARGRLGILTSVCLRAFPLPAHERVLVLKGAKLTSLIEPALLAGTAPVLPVSIVVVGQLSALDGSSALVLRLHGAESTVDADQSAIEKHLGIPLDRLAEQEADGCLTEIRDRGGLEPRCVEVSVLPSRLSQVVAAADEVGVAKAVIDSYAGRLRMGSSDMSADGVSTFRGAVESLGGALRVTRWDGVTRPKDTSCRGAELQIAQRLESIFDPAGVLWPARQ